MRQQILGLTAALLVGGTAVVGAATPQADVNNALRANPEIYNGLFTAALIKHVVDTCPAVSPPGRLARVGYFLSLYNRARGMGYDRAQIEAFVQDKAEQARMRVLVAQYLRDAGVNPESEADVCAFARAEMAGRTTLGRQLREN